MKISTILDHIDSGHMALPELSGDMCGIAIRWGCGEVRVTDGGFEAIWDGEVCNGS